MRVAPSEQPQLAFIANTIHNKTLSLLHLFQHQTAIYMAISRVTFMTYEGSIVIDDTRAPKSDGKEKRGQGEGEITYTTQLRT